MRTLLVLCLTLFAACNSRTTLEPRADRELQIAHIAGYNPGDPQIAIPATVRRGESFPVRITTYGNGCVSEGETRLEGVGTNSVRVTPYDSVFVGGVCTQELRSFLHEATLSFPQAGTAAVTFRGYDIRSRSVIEVRRSVTVTP